MGFISDLFQLLLISNYFTKLSDAKQKSSNEVTRSFIRKCIECTLKFNLNRPVTGIKSLSSTKTETLSLDIVFGFLNIKFDTKLLYKKRQPFWALVSRCQTHSLGCHCLNFCEKRVVLSSVNTYNPVLMTWLLKLSVVIQCIFLWTVFMKRQSLSQLLKRFNAFYDT